MIPISIIVCTHRRFDLLNYCINSLADQLSNKSLFEVLVVDNDLNENAEVKEIVKKSNDKINIRYIHENILGLSQARNKGGKESKGMYIGYIDDDAKVSTNYIETALKIIHDFDPDFFGGPYLPYYISKKPHWFKDEYECGFPAESTRFLNNTEYLNGTNMIYKRSLLESLNWFDINFGMKGKQISYGEETDLQIRAWQQHKNLKAYFSKELIVYHVVLPAKLKIFDRFKRKYNTGRSQTYIWIKKENIKSIQRKSMWQLFKLTLFFVIKETPKLILRDRKKYPFWQNYAYEETSKYAASLGQEIKLLKDLIFNQ